MLKRYLSGAIVGLAASLSLATAVRAADSVANFNDITTEMVFSDTWDYGGLSFAGYQFWILPPDFVMDNPSTFPSPVNSTVMSTYIEPMEMTLTGGGAFDLKSLSTALGWFNDDNPDFTDTETVVGHKANCIGQGCTITTTFSVGYFFQNHIFEGFTNLSSVTFSALTAQQTPDGFDYTGFIGFDDITFAPVPPDNGGGGAVPEPASWAMMIVGMGGIGALMRRRGRFTAPQTA